MITTCKAQTGAQPQKHTPLKLGAVCLWNVRPWSKIAVSHGCDSDHGDHHSDWNHRIMITMVVTGATMITT